MHGEQRLNKRTAQGGEWETAWGPETARQTHKDQADQDPQGTPEPQTDTKTDGTSIS